MSKINFAVIGCGHIGKRHAEMIMRHPEAELVAIVDVKTAEETQVDSWGIPFFNSLEELLESNIHIDVINIATPNGFHADHALKALKAKKHVVIEKPLALESKSAEKVLHKSFKMNRHVFGVMQNRFSPPSVWIKDIIESNTLGEIYMVQLICYWNRDERYYTPGGWHGKKELDGGTLYTQFSHFIDILYWLFGDLKNIHSRLFDFKHKELTEFEDSGFVTFDFVHGGSGILNFSTAIWDKNLESSMTIIAEKGSVKIGGQYMDKVEYCHVKDYTLPDLAPTNPGNDYGAYKGSAQNHNFVIENVIDVLKQRGSISTNALEGLKVVDIIERIYASSKK